MGTDTKRRSTNALCEPLSTSALLFGFPRSRAFDAEGYGRVNVRSNEPDLAKPLNVSGLDITCERNGPDKGYVSKPKQCKNRESGPDQRETIWKFLIQQNGLRLTSRLNSY